VRAGDQAPIATPLHWDELSDTRTRPDRWTLATLPNRLEQDGDPWKQFATHAETIRKVRRLLAETLPEALAKDAHDDREGDDLGRSGGAC
jgi:DNA primase